MTPGRHASSRFTRSAVLFALAGAASGASAEETAQDQGQWRATVGAGVTTMPKYPGSDSEKTRAFPLVNLRYQRFFVGSAPGSASPGGFGIYLCEDDTWSVGAIAAHEAISPRKESDDVRLHGLGDIDATTRAGMFASYRTGWLSVEASVLSDIGDNGQGTVANLDAKATYYPFPRLQLSAGPGLTWANTEYTQTFFGIDLEQANRSGLAQYQASSGVALLRFSLGAQYELTPHWGLGAKLTAARLQGDAADSPIVEDKNQNTYAVFCRYRF